MKENEVLDAILCELTIEELEPRLEMALVIDPMSIMLLDVNNNNNNNNNNKDTGNIILV